MFHSRPPLLLQLGERNSEFLRTRRTEAGGTEDAFVGSSTRTAVGEFAVDNDGWHTTNSILFRLLRCRAVVHVMNGHFTGFARDSSHHLDRFLAGSTPCAKHFHVSFRGHCGVTFQ